MSLFAFQNDLSLFCFADVFGEDQLHHLGSTSVGDYTHFVVMLQPVPSLAVSFKLSLLLFFAVAFFALCSLNLYSITPLIKWIPCCLTFLPTLYPPLTPPTSA